MRRGASRSDKEKSVGRRRKAKIARRTHPKAYLKRRYVGHEHGSIGKTRSVTSSARARKGKGGRNEEGTDERTLFVVGSLVENEIRRLE